jgi:hypothetical protein
MMSAARCTSEAPLYTQYARTQMPMPEAQVRRNVLLPDLAHSF